MGRWSRITLQGGNDQLVTFITAYMVCKNSLATAGPSTCWMQQQRMLKKKGLLKPDPCKQFLTDLTKLLNELQEKEH
eukprot:4631563-Ditylum_brightwellii.AAC.1